MAANFGVTVDDNPKYGIAPEGRVRMPGIKKPKTPFGSVGTPVVQDRGLEHMPQIKDNKQKSLRQMKMVEGFRKSNGKVAPRNRHAFKLAAMQRKKKAGPPMKASGSIG